MERVQQEIIEVLKAISIREHIFFAATFQFDDGPERGEAALVSNCDPRTEQSMLQQGALERLNTMIASGEVELVRRRDG
jgi:hypothetical protein